MAGDILRIKTTLPPERGSVLERRHIIEHLERGLSEGGFFTRPLSLVSAPAGFGKTTLVRRWMADHEPVAHWLSLDPGDDDFLAFWTYLIEALRTADPDLGKGALELLEDTGSPGDHTGFLVPLLNDLFARTEPGFLVLDDYHCIDEPAIHRSMAFLIERLPPNLHLVVTTRSDPPWPLSRWRAREQMAEVRLQLLRFDDEEAGRFLEERGISALTPSQVRALHQRTEGWPTGLQLAAVSMGQSPDPEHFVENFTGSHQHVLHFLQAEVLSGVGSDVRDFLLKTSILRRLSPSLCRAITGREDSARVLDYLVRTNLFTIPLDHSNHWYRYHPLFGQLLSHTLRREHPEDVQRIHERAAHWHSENGEPSEAVHHALRAQSARLLGDLVDEHYRLFMLHGPATLNRVLRRLPDEAVHRHPRLTAHRALFHLVYGGRDEAEESRRAAAELGYDDPDEDREYRGILAAIDAYFRIYADDYPGARRHCERALALLAEDNHYWRMNAAIYAGDAALFSDHPGDALSHYLEAHRNSLALRDEGSILAAGTAFKVATALYALGQPESAEKMLRETLKSADERGFAGVARLGILWGLLGELMREKNRLDEARQYSERAMALSQVESPSLAWNALHSVALSHSTGDLQGALRTLGMIDGLDAEKRLPGFIIRRARAWEARVLMGMGMAGRALEVLADEGIAPGAEVVDGKTEGFLVLADIMIREEWPVEEAERILGELESRARSRENRSLLLQVLLSKATITGEDQSTMEEALELGWGMGFFRAFADLGEPLLEPLRAILLSPPSKPSPILRYAGDILDHLDPGQGDTPTATGAPSGEPPEPLSDRQLDVLHLIGEGLSNDQIADRLFLSLGTVKWHTSNIYGRLGVRNRTEAVTRARRMGILEDK